MENLEKSIITFFENHDIHHTRTHFLLACSGGKDSMVLAHALVRLNIDFQIAHCNFQLRGEDSDGDANFVQSFCEENKIPLHLKSFHTKEKSQDEGKSIQMVARELRYSFFKETCKNHSINYILTAHHLNDSLETQFINLGRGSGIKGLQGIPPKNGNILRPLHLCSREEMDAYQEKKSIEWREDSSNASDNYQRNFIRHHIHPLLRKSQSNFEKGYLQSLKNVQSDVELYSFLLENIKNEICVSQESGFDIDLEKLEAYPSKISILKYILEPCGFSDLLSIEKSYHLLSGKAFESEKYAALVDREFLKIRKKELADDKTYFIQASEKAIEFPISLEINKIPAKRIDLKNFASESAAMDFDTLVFPLELRKWKKGDRFQPLGMQKSKKLSDFFIDEKVNRLEKSKLWLLCSGHDIVWIIGYRINDRYKITELTKTAYFVRPMKKVL